MSRLEEIETTLGPRHLFDRDTYGDSAIVRATTRRAQLQEWLLLQGVPRVKIFGNFSQNALGDMTLAKAYFVGERYVAALMRDETSTRRRKPTGDFLDFNETVTTLEAMHDAKPIGELLDQPISGEIPEVPPTSSAIVVNSDSIARAAAAAIALRLESAKRDLQVQTSAAITKMETRVSEVERNIYTANDRRWTQAEVHFKERTRSLVEDVKKEVVEIADRLMPRRIEIKTPTSTIELAAEIRHNKFDECLRWLLGGEHLYGVGPAGTGKSHLGEQLAQGIGKRFLPIGQSLTKYDVSGYKGPTGEYFGTIARDAIENGGFLFVDEGDMWASTALGFLNNPLANGWCAFPDKMVKVHPNFQCMICANTFGRGATQDYIGRNPLDAASLDRFAYVIIDYDEDMERLIYGNGPWLQYIHRVRAAVAQLKMRHVISQRAIRRALRGIAANLSVDQVCFSALWRGLDLDSIQKIKNIAGEPPKPVVETFEIDEDEPAIEFDLAAEGN